MKTMRTCTAATALVALLSLAQASPAADNGSCNAAMKEKTFTGDVTAVDAPEKTLSVKGFWLTRNFNTAADCKVSLGDKAAALAELRPGQRVDVRYESDNGVLIARSIAQHDLAYTGRITAIDPAAHKLSVKEGLLTHDLAIAPDCEVSLKGNQAGTWANLQVGDAIRVCYETPNGPHIARRIEQTGDMFTGTIQAVDATSRTIKVEGAHGERKFNLADSCPIVINGRLNGGMSDLRIGDRVSLSYEDRNGVLVANRVSPMNAATAEPAAPAPSQTAKTVTQPPFYGY